MIKTTEYVTGNETILIHHPTTCNFGYSISMGSGGWLPGIYDSIDSAKLGVSACFIDEKAFVTELQQKVNHIDKQNRELTIVDINDWLVSKNFK